MSALIALLVATVPAASDTKIAENNAAYNKPAPAGKLSTANPHSIVAYLQKEGYKAKLVTDDGDSPYIESAANGASFYIYLQNCKAKKDCQDTMFQSSYEQKEDAPIKVDAINKYNADNRWARAYLDKEGDPVIEYDVLFTDQLVDEKMFGEALEIWTSSLSRFHETIGF